jgi:polyisoprenoid-binding protein YceI
MRQTALALLVALTATPALAAPERWVLDPGHSQILFSYDHFGFSTTWAMFSGFTGEILWDREDPAASSVTVAFPVRSMLTGWEARFDAFMTPDFLDAADDSAMVTFTSTAIAVTGATTADITGDLTLNGVTRPVVLAAELNAIGPDPMSGRDWAGFDATTTLLRSDFGLGAFAPAIGDAVSVQISIEAGRAD